ncbi:MAG: hypothetical protein ACRCTZ_22595 [Sarcina sp.]
MSKLNDEKILRLKEEILKKKEVMTSCTKRFNPITSCILDLDGVSYNLNVLNSSELKLLYVKLNMLGLSANAIPWIDVDEIILSGFKLQEWMEDVEMKLSVIMYREEKSKLDAMEKKLDKLLSEEKKVAMEIDEIESLLK